MFPAEAKGQILHTGATAGDKWTDNNILAAILLTLGVELQLDIHLEESGAGRREIRWMFSADHPFFGGGMTALTFANLYRSGDLFQQAPDSIAFVMESACRNRERILAWLKGGPAHHLAIRRGGHYRYEPGAHEPPAALCRGTLSTPDLALACALGVLGVPLLAISGQPPELLFTLAGAGFAMGPQWKDFKIADAEAFTLEFRGGGLPGIIGADHPFWWAYEAVRSIQKIIRHAKEARPKVIIQKKNSVRCAIVAVGASPSALDMVSRHFRRGE